MVIAVSGTGGIGDLSEMKNALFLRFNSGCIIIQVSLC